MEELFVAITEANYSGNKGAAAMLQSSITQLRDIYGEKIHFSLISVWPDEDRKLIPGDFVEVVPAQAWKLVFVAFPLSILYWVFRWCNPICRLLTANAVLRAYSTTDLVLDEAGVSFVDSRGFVMNTFAFICMAIPLLMGKPVIKYSQALGSFKKIANRIQAKIILPHIRMILARGAITKAYLADIDIADNVRICADGVFSLKDDPAILRSVDEICAQDPFFESDKIVGVSPSTVVAKKCRKKNINYVHVMTEFVEYLVGKGYPVLIFANTAREHTDETRNNDLIICRRIFDNCKDRQQIRYYHREMKPEEILSFVGKCRFVVASRFHAMIFSLIKRVPVMLIGWSHKYQEVLDDFELGKYATDYSELSCERMIEGFSLLVENEHEIRSKIETHYDSVMASSYQNIAFVSEELDRIIERKRDE
ncbi:MAG: polysaccharide pyruvyl transferase family protein [Lachnospiraceae bacterium]|nr:polysaccharide pyruvyl transferase family protein [Lachnospiraceae bacterium]